jgi:cytosine/uracil/thiamine/allantoin permease
MMRASRAAMQHSQDDLINAKLADLAEEGRRWTMVRNDKVWVEELARAVVVA